VSSPVRVRNPDFIDDHGRTLILRGVNLGGSSKVPCRPADLDHRRESFFDHRNVSFVGRPFPLREADEHFSRLRAWGFTVLRFLVTWEAIEHAGPGIYDEEYLDYVRNVVRRADDFGFGVLIDPNQDVWSRFSGGDGAPGWTFEAAGMDLARLQDAGAAVVRALTEGAYPRMVWPTNETKLAAATMSTLFFGGNDFAPARKAEDEPVQDYLQGRYIAAVCRLAQALRGLPNVIGYDTLNEPMFGYIGWRDLSMAEEVAKVGPAPSPYQSMLLGSGFPLRVATWSTGRLGIWRTGSRMVNPGGARVWLPGRECVWRESGVWDTGRDGKPRLLQPHYFARRNGRPVDFAQDYYLPFARRFTEAVRAVDPGAVIFVEAGQYHLAPRWNASNIAFAPHWYDGYVLFKKDFSAWIAVDTRARRLVFTPWCIPRSFATQLGRFRSESAERLGGAPVLLGEFGVPFDMQDKRAYRTGDFRTVTRAMDRTLRALDDALLSGTLWNYAADNTNALGDRWNEEDLSIFSRDQQTNPGDIHSGGRSLEAVVRPYARATAGEPLGMRFDLPSRTFDYTFRHDPQVRAPTEIFVPAYQYPHGFSVEVSDGGFSLDKENQLVLYRHGSARDVHRIRIRPKRTEFAMIDWKEKFSRKAARRLSRERAG
jgi:hypothetical protein